ncbi:outer membrane protein assembly factor BamD [Candidatus Pelagibacter sp.]|jgi:outer membrane protein assembly factor BamD|nr:outer membrane protein assembly factor BamD [Candidatus Pelagibacter sp.]
MKSTIKLVIILIICNLYSCSNKDDQYSKIKEVNQEQEMITTYKEAMENLNKGDTYFAAKKFLEAELLFPQSDWAPKSSLMASYSYYLQDYYSEAIFNLENYIKTYPADSRMSYARFLLAMCYYETIEDEKKDLEPLLSARKEFNFIIKNYPDTDYALDSKFKNELIDDVLAAKEMYLGRHYIKKERWIPAINRFKNVLKDYETTIYAEEAIHRLVEVHYKLGMKEESKKYAKLLGYNYQSSEWYKKSYKVFNKDYEISKIKKDKKKESIIKKFKKISKFF